MVSFETRSSEHTNLTVTLIGFKDILSVSCLCYVVLLLVNTNKLLCNYCSEQHEYIFIAHSVIQLVTRDKLLCPVACVTRNKVNNIVTYNYWKFKYIKTFLKHVPYFFLKPQQFFDLPSSDNKDLVLQHTQQDG